MESQEYKELIRLINRLDARMDKIENALVGDTRLGQMGIAKRLSDLEGEVEKLDRRFSKMIWMVVGASSGATGIVQMLLGNM